MQALIDAAISSGAYKAEVVTADRLVLSHEFVDICKTNQCGKYGKCWMCPPAVGDIDEMMEKAGTFPNVLIYQYVGQLEDSFDIEGMEEAGKVHTVVSQKLNDLLPTLLHAEYLHLSKGGCGLCETCTIIENKPCRFPDKALASLESYGVDVYQSVKDTSLRYINGQNTVTYFGMVLFSE